MAGHRRATCGVTGRVFAVGQDISGNEGEGMKKWIDWLRDLFTARHETAVI